MTDLVTPGEVDAEIDNRSMGYAIQQTSGDGWIVNGTELSDAHANLDETNVNAFEHVETAGFDVTLDGGEAYLHGWLCRDRDTTITLNSSSTTDIYLGYNVGAVLGTDQTAEDVENIIIGPASDFGSKDPMMKIWTFTTNDTTVTETTDHRITEKPLRTQDGDVYAFDENITGHIQSTSNPHNVTATQLDVYTTTEADDRFLEVSGDSGGLQEDLDFNRNQALDMVLETRVERPSNPTRGQIWIIENEVTGDDDVEVQTQQGLRRLTMEEVFRIIENWEHGDTTQWTSDGGGTFEIDTTVTQGSDASAHIYNGTKRVQNHPNSDGTLAHYPERGDYWRFYYRPNDMTGQSRTRFAMNDVDPFADAEYFEIQTYDAGTFRLRERTDANGTNTIAAYYDVPYQLGDWYEIEIWFDHPDQSAEFRCTITHLPSGTQEANISGNSQYHTADTGGIQLYVNSGADIHWGALEIVDRP